MDYKEKYEDALERAKSFELPEYKNIMAFVFPELKESEDERIRKFLIEDIKDTLSSEDFRNYNSEYTENLKEALTWLENQCEQKPIIDGILTATNYDKIFQNCNVHKFKVGDLIKHNKANIICKVISVNSGSYYVENIETSGRIELFNAEQNFHLWTINDAKDGDVLDANGAPFIYKKHDKDYVYFYCGVNLADEFVKANVFDIWNNNNKVYPATKEQRDLLFQKMEEAGYMWDSKSKQLLSLKSEPSDKQKFAWIKNKR